MTKLGSSLSVSCTSGDRHHSHPWSNDSPTHGRLEYCRNSTSTQAMVTIHNHQTNNGACGALTVRPTACQLAMIRLALQLHRDLEPRALTKCLSLIVVAMIHRLKLTAMRNRLMRPPPICSIHSSVHEANYISLEDYAQELAFLPASIEPSVTEHDYTTPNVKNPSFVGDQQRRLDDVLKKQEAIMISSGNALPPPAYGLVCDIDVQGHPPIKQRARRITLRHLQKLYELLK
ncbi:hypothetical protein PHMEG_00024504 [Phytophthora megakarya]|uniref:Reverse transcriptase n=1 Tax=Phytophthora megakarya TaxID=4795 RepID=A0A225VDJ8_9STRA|nr:hypothetical protein PHMEG_00024504 [Phytophthora megakarya]